MIRKVDVRPLGLPVPHQFARNCRGAAILDAILEPRWEFRYFSFDPRWGPDGEAMGSMRNGEGDHWHFIQPSAESSFCKGYFQTGRRRDPADLMADRWAHVVPQPFHRWLMEPAFYVDETSHCFWWTFNGWEGATADDGIDVLALRNLTTVAGGSRTYVEWAEEMYEVQLERASVEALWSATETTAGALHALNPGLSDFSELASLGLAVVS